MGRKSCTNYVTVWPEPIWKKSKDFSTSTTTASKYIPKRPRICINWNPPFQTQIYLVKVPLNVNIVKQDLLYKKQFLKILLKWCLRGGISIDTDSGPLGYVLWCCGSRSQDFFYFYSNLLWPFCASTGWCVFIQNYFAQRRVDNLSDK